jgi:erythronate-4-phosphate dehydrogenase
VRIIADENIPYVAEAFAGLGEVRTISGRAMTAEAVKDADILLVRSVKTRSDKGPRSTER